MQKPSPKQGRNSLALNVTPSLTRGLLHSIRRKPELDTTKLGAKASFRGDMEAASIYGAFKTQPFGSIIPIPPFNPTVAFPSFISKRCERSPQLRSIGIGNGRLFGTSHRRVASVGAVSSTMRRGNFGCRR